MDSSTTAIRPASASASQSAGDDAPIAYLRWVFTEGVDAHHPSIGQVIPIRAPITLGRQPPPGPGAVALSHVPWASRAHARVSPIDAEHIQIEDLASSNGTFVDGQRVVAPVRARVGQIVRIGGAIFVVGSAPMAQRATLLQSHPPPEEFIAWSWAALSLWHQIVRAAGHRHGVLLLGETGTGKTRLARLIHGLGADAAAPFIAQNCSAIPRNLEELTLFGVEDKAVPDARGRKGLLTLAGAGTLFLDELADLSASAQAKVLDAFDPTDPSYLPVAAEARLQTRCRFVSATNRPVDGVIRADLLSRLVVSRIDVPPLRQRREGMLAILHRALKQAKMPPPGAPALGIEEAEAILLAPWFENVRGLESLARRMASGERMDAQGIALHGRRGAGPAPVNPARISPPQTLSRPPAPAFLWPPQPDQALTLLARQDWQIRAAAESIGRRRETLSRHIKRLFGGLAAAQQAWQIWQASGRLPERAQIASLARLFAPQPETPTLTAARDAWRHAGQVPPTP